MDYKKNKRVTKAPRKPLVEVATIPAPISGINSRDPLAAMDQNYAISAINFMATPQGLSVRQGWKKWSTGITGLVSSLLIYQGQGAAADKIFACAGNSIYDVTGFTDSPSKVVTSLLNADWEHVLMTTNGGNYLVACNGADTARFYNGSTWNQFSLVATPSAPGQIKSGSTMTNLTNWKQVVVHQRRLWIVVDNSTTAYYLPVDSVGGDAVPFDFGPVFPRGGKLKALASWAVNTGLGIQNYLVAVSTAGDVAIYSGTNPSTATTWAIAGTWQLGEPVGQRCFANHAGDLLYLSQDGLQPLSLYIRSQRIDDSTALTLLVQNDITALVKSFGSLKGFEVRTYPGQNVLILNVPQINANQNFQYVYNTITKGWTLFQGWPAQCWAQLNGRLFFGYDGGVAHAFTGYRDQAELDGSGGVTYIATAQQAYSYFGQPAIRKRFQMAKPYLVTTDAAPKVRVSCNVNFSLDPPRGAAALKAGTGSFWDVGVWDNAVWSNGANTYSSWQGLGAVGTTASLAVSISVNDSTLWAATDWIYEPGGVFG